MGKSMGHRGGLMHWFWFLIIGGIPCSTPIDKVFLKSVDLNCKYGGGLL